MSYGDHFRKLKKNANLSSHQASSQKTASVLKSRPTSKKRKQRFPAAQLAAFLFFATCGGWVFINWEQITTNLEKIEISMMGKIFADATQAPTGQSAQWAASANSEATSSAAAPARKDWTHFERLQLRLQEIEKREKDLEAREVEIRRMERELDTNLAELTKVREEISKILSDRTELDDKNLGSLVQMYSSMRPAQAAKVFEGMNADLAVQILQKMKKNVAAEIMNMLSTDRAKFFSEKLMGIRDRSVASGSGE